MKLFIRLLKNLFAVIVLSAFISQAFSAQRRPNVIIVNLDDLGSGWLAPYTKKLKPSDMDEGALRLFLISIQSFSGQRMPRFSPQLAERRSQETIQITISAR